MSNQLQTASTGAAVPAFNLLRGNRQRQLLTEPVVFEDDSLPAFVRVAVLATALLLVAFVLWASAVHIDEVATAPGQVVPSASVKVVEHLEGGTIAEILITEGQLVQAGQVLLRMDPAQPKSELEQLRSRYIALLARNERLRAMIEQREPDFSALPQEYPEMIEDQRKIWAGQVATQRTAIEVIDSQIDQKRREVKQLGDALKIANKHLTVTTAQVEIREKAVAEGIVSRQTYLETKRAQVTAEGEVIRLREQIQVATDSLTEVEKRRRNLSFTQQQEALSEQGSVSGELEQVKNGLTKLQDRVDRLEIRSPVTGLIQDLKMRTAGGILPPGGLIAKVVPVNDELEAEVRISPVDIGHVKVGQKVKVKLTTYDYTRYGTLPATLEKISASTFVMGTSTYTFADDQQKPYYRGVVRLARPYLGPGEGQNPVLPGMGMEADIVTGNKRLIEYLLKPVYVSLKGSFHER